MAQHNTEERIRQRSSYKLFGQFADAMELPKPAALRRLWAILDGERLFGTARKAGFARESVEQLIADRFRAPRESDSDEGASAPDDSAHAPEASSDRPFRRKHDVGDIVLAEGKPGIVDDYDEEDNTYRVSFNAWDFGWYGEDEIQGEGRPRAREDAGVKQPGQRCHAGWSSADNERGAPGEQPPRGALPLPPDGSAPQDGHGVHKGLKYNGEEETSGAHNDKPEVAAISNDKKRADSVFGDVIFRYTDADAVQDGVLVQLQTPAGADTGHRITRNALEELKRYHRDKAEESEDSFLRYVLLELLPIAGTAAKLYEAGGVLKTGYDFSNVGRGQGVLWYLPNEVGGITIMKPEDY